MIIKKKPVNPDSCLHATKECTVGVSTKRGHRPPSPVRAAYFRGVKDFFSSIGNYAREDIAYRLLPSVGGFIFVVIVFICLSGRAGNLLGDADTGYHIRAGDFILKTLSVPDRDIFSHITPPPEWTAHEWLSEAIFSLIHKASGLGGIVAFAALLIAAVYALLFRFLRASGAGVVISALLTVLAASASTVHWLARPHLFSLLFTLLFYMALDAHEFRGGRLYALPPLMALWVNLHGGFIAGFLLLGIYASGNFVGALSGDSGKKTKLKRLLFIFFFCWAAALLNPNGGEILLFPFRLAGEKFIMDNIREWHSPNFHEGLMYEYMLLLTILALGASALRLSAVEAMLLLIFTHMSLYSARHIPLYALVASPIIGRRIEHVLTGLRYRRPVRVFLSKSRDIEETDSRAGGHLWPLITAAVVVSLVFSGQIDGRFDRDGVPGQAVAFIKKERIPGNMFNEDEFGDYIIYAAWPGYRVFFDGRNDMYGPERLGEYVKVVGVEQGWQEVLKKYGINWIICRSDSLLSRFLLADDGWCLIYSDGVGDIFLMNAERNAALIKKYRDAKPIFKKKAGETS